MGVKTSNFFKTFYLAGLVVAFTVGIVHIAPKTACAVAAPATACDPEYMDALEGKAFMEAQREISQNKNFIFKPDSVLEYTCFDRIASSLAGRTPFSERFGAVDRGTDSLDNAFNAAVGGAIRGYMTNFDHPYLNGRAGGDGLLASDTTIGGSGYGCSQMRRVWVAATCMNMQNDTSLDRFFDFPWYASNDPRKRPSPLVNCTAAIPASPHLAMAYNGKQSQYTGPENPLSAAPYKIDPIVTYFDKINPGDCAAGIPTGITISGGTEEKVCPNPGCYFEGGSCK